MGVKATPAKGRNRARRIAGNNSVDQEPPVSGEDGRGNGARRTNPSRSSIPHGTNYAAGRRLEWSIRKLLREDGYLVIRAAGSKSPVDLVAVNDEEVVFIQCKYGGKPQKPEYAPVPTNKLMKVRYMLIWKPRGGEPKNLWE